MPEPDINVSSPDDIRHFVLTELAKIQASTVPEIEQQIQGQGGDMEIDSPEGVSIAHGLEGHLGRDLVKASDLLPNNFNSIESLTKYLYESSQRPQGKKRRNR
jgi:hypothetical protein